MNFVLFTADEETCRQCLGLGLSLLAHHSRTQGPFREFEVAGR